MEVNGTIKVINNEIMLIIAQDDFKKFQKYENISSSKKFYAGFSLGNEQLYITGLFEKEKKNQEDNTVIIPISSASKQGNGKAFTTATEIKTLLGLDNTKKEVEVQMLQHSKKQLEELKPKMQELQDQLDAANKGKEELQEQLNNRPSAAQLQEKEDKIKELEAKDQEITQLKTQKGAVEKEKQALEDANKKAKDEKTTLEEQLKKKGEELETANKTIEEKVEELETAKKEAEEKITELETQLKTQPDAAQLQDKDEKIKDLEAQLSNRPDAAQLQDEEDKIKELEAKINQPNAEVEKLKNDLKTKTSQVQQLTQKNKELEAKNKTTEQPKQGNGARYTATVGMGLAAGLIAFTALERTVRLEMLVMIGIAVASALVAGGITYAALPSTQVDGAKAQGVNENRKKK